jgi:PAS domain S-box-containing protein
LHTILLTKAGQPIPVLGKVIIQVSNLVGLEFWIVWHLKQNHKVIREPRTNSQVLPHPPIQLQKTLLQYQLQLRQAHTELLQCQLIEQQLWDSEARFQRLTSHLPGVIYRFERSTLGRRYFTYISAGSLDLYELSPNTIIENSSAIWYLVHPEDRSSLIASIRSSEQVLEDWLWEGRIVTPSGQLKWIQGQARPQAQPEGHIIWDGLIIDITQRKQALLELEASEARFRAIFDQAAVGMNRVDLSGRFLQANQRFRQMLGYSSQELQQLTIQEITHPDDWQAHLPLMQQLSCGKISFYSLEKRLICQDGRIQWINLSVSLVRDSQGKPLFDIGIVEDINDRKQAEAKIIEALAKERELNQIKSHFIRIVSHEFRTPLTTIISSADILENLTLTEQECKKFLQQIINASYQMNTLISDMVFLEKSGTEQISLNPIALNLKHFCERVHAELALAYPQTPLSFAIKGPEATLQIDEQLLRKILLNLISNAVKYSAPQAPVQVTLTQSPTQISFQVKDQGQGIPPKDCPLIFDLFHRAKNIGTVAGTGLGLAIVKRCVELCDGEITFESTEGQGSTFTVSFAHGPKGEGIK